MSFMLKLAKHAHDDAFNSEIDAGLDLYRCEMFVGGPKHNPAALRVQALDSNFVIDPRHDDLSMIRRACRDHGDEVIVEYSSIFHAVALYAQKHLRHHAKHPFRNGNRVEQIFYGQHGLASGDASHDGHLDVARCGCGPGRQRESPRSRGALEHAKFLDGNDVLLRRGTIEAEMRRHIFARRRPALLGRIALNEFHDLALPTRRRAGRCLLGASRGGYHTNVWYYSAGQNEAQSICATGNELG